jgi:hypothetical protein
VSDVQDFDAIKLLKFAAIGSGTGREGNNSSLCFL